MKVSQIQTVTTAALANALLPQGWDLFQVVAGQGGSTTYVMVRYAITTGMPLELLTLLSAVRASPSLPVQVQQAMVPFASIAT